MKSTHSITLVLMAVGAVAAAFLVSRSLRVDAEQGQASEASTPADRGSTAALARDVEPDRRESPPSDIAMGSEASAKGSNPTDAPPTEDVADAAFSKALEKLRAARDSFFTNAPDAFGLDESLRALAGAAVIDPQSAVKSPDGAIRGEIGFPGAELSGQYEVRGGSCTITLRTTPSDVHGTPVAAEEISFGFDDASGSIANAFESVQAHPDVRSLELARAMEGRSEAIVGWTVGFGDSGVHGTPISIAPHESGWLVGRSRQVVPLELPGAWDRGTMHEWSRLLSAVRD